MSLTYALAIKSDVDHDISVDGPEIAAQAMKAGLVDEFQMIICPVVVGGESGSFRMVWGWT
jgi:dihydrofolate reductase